MKRLFKHWLLSTALCVTSASYAASPDCTGIDRWATKMALVELRNMGRATNDNIEVAKTKTIRLASERIGRDLYRQIHLVVFTETTGGTIEVITSNDASSKECSMSGVEVFVISKRMGK